MIIEGLLQFSAEYHAINLRLDLRYALSQDKVDDNLMTGSALDAGESGNSAKAVMIGIKS